MQIRLFYALLAFLAMASAISADAAGHFTFSVDAKSSGLTANISVAALTAGTLIGNYDPTANPTGTRTKPGLFGSFGETENLPVDINLDLAVVGSPKTSNSGGFEMSLDVETGTLTLSNYNVDLLNGASPSLTLEVTLETASFRTRSPSSTYLGGIPITLPLGSATLLSLTASQVDSETPGLLIEIEPGRYSFAVAPLVAISGEVDLLGTPQPIDVPAAPLALAGEVVISGASATISIQRALDVTNTQMPNQILPQIPLDLPTILPPGGVASVLLDLTLAEITSGLTGTQTLHAIGEKQAAGQPGDMNCDGVVSVSDIGPFVLALSDPAGYAAAFPDCDLANGDVNVDGSVTVSDIGPFVLLLTGG